MAGGKRRRDSIHETPDVSYISNPDVAHEHTDVPVTPVLKFIGGLVVFFGIAFAAMYLMFLFFQRREVNAERRPSPLQRQGEERLPPEPRLQLAPGFGVTSEDGKRVTLAYDQAGQTETVPQPQSEYWTVRDEWERKLKGYGWVDEQAGTVRVPVEEAMRVYQERQQAKSQGQQPGASPQPSPQASPAGQ
ncbi:MAG TPA: hypothetical protein VFS10_14745 [Pyrinomonadaceae bacterium]|nr:hypothetical protein [Pyrinomonadaceae bacterium]